MNLLVFSIMSLFFYSSLAFADSDGERIYQDPKEDAAVFEELYRGDAKSIVNFYRIKELDIFNRGVPKVLNELSPANWSLPGNHKETCKKYFFNEKECPLSETHYYVIYNFHGSPTKDAPIVGAYIVGREYAGYKSDKLLKSFYWKKKIFSENGKVAERDPITYPFEKTYQYTYLKDIKKDLNKEGNEVTWIRLIDTKEGKPVWLYLDEAFADKSGIAMIQYLKDDMRVTGLEKGKAFFIAHGDKNKKRVPIKIRQENSEKVIDDWVWGEYCFEKIENGRLYFRAQRIDQMIDQTIDKRSPNFPKQKEYREYFEKKFKGLPDVIYSLSLDEYLKHNYVRHVEPGWRDCPIDSYYMDKGIDLSGSELEMQRAIKIRNDPDFLQNYR